MSLAHSTLAACNRHHHGAPAIVLSRGVGRVHVAGNPFDLSDYCSAADPPSDSAAAIILHRLVPPAVASPSASSAERPIAASSGERRVGKESARQCTTGGEAVPK